MLSSNQPPPPIAAFNEWSCALACVSWVMEKHNPISQKEIIYRHGLWFPEWFHREGLMNRGDILNLFERLNIPIRKFTHINEKEESLKIVTKYFSSYFAGFVLTRKPTNHCLAIANWDGDKVKIMEPDRMAPKFREIQWDDLFQNQDADVLWLFL